MAVPFRITVRVSEETMEKLEELVDSFNFDSVSDVIRKSIEEFIDRHYEPARKKKIDLLLPKSIMNDVQDEVDQSDKISLEDLVSIVIKNYNNRRMNEEMKNLTTGAFDHDKKGKRKLADEHGKD